MNTPWDLDTDFEQMADIDAQFTAEAKALSVAWNMGLTFGPRDLMRECREMLEGTRAEEPTLAHLRVMADNRDQLKRALDEMGRVTC